MSKFYYDHVENELLHDEIWADARAHFSSKNAILLTREISNEMNFHMLFDLRLTFGPDHYELYLAIPKSDRRNIAIPFDLADHGQIKINNFSIQNTVEDFINKNLSGKIYMFSCDRNICNSVASESFSYDDLLSISLTNLNTPIIIFDDTLSIAAFFHFDFNVTIISLPRGSRVLLGGAEDAWWRRYFIDHFRDAAYGGEVHVRGIIENYFFPLGLATAATSADITAAQATS
ncbi:hypothetical protein [Labrys monachus]|uniref:Uncharacterized protein n=1 Tax=Labrys monachus TaxID=217067 RepID=A0ABU0FKC9_9HYPH|nr:hypothetical protein [Labrys monachus]MDQ0395067.1 hypothetical protein [Labrys monachus]